MRLHDLTIGLPLTPIREGDAEVRTICTDSRVVEPGALFFAREGWFIDSHAFIPSALQAGATALVVTRADGVPDDCPVPVFLSTAEDRDLGLVTDRFFGHPTDRLCVYGITGTNGKTSVAYVLEHILKALGERPAVIGTVTHRFENRVIPSINTTPDGLLIHGFARESLEAGATALILEVSSHGAVLGRIAGTAFDSVGFTNLTPEHLDYHVDLEGYLAAKQLLFSDGLRDSVARGKTVSAAAFVDDPAGARMLASVPDEAGRRCVSLVSDDADVRCREVESLGARGLRFEATVDGVTQYGKSALIGEHNLANVAVALAMAAATHPGRSAEAVASLSGFPGIPGRYEAAVTPRPGEGGIFVDYAHTSDAVTRALEVLGGVAQGRTTVVVGCGGDRDRSKRGPMLQAALSGADRVIATSDNPRGEDPNEILDEMEQRIASTGLKRVTRIVDRSDAIDLAVRDADGPVLVAGKGHEPFQEIGTTRYHLDDCEEVRRATAAIRYGAATSDQPLLSGWSAERIALEVGGRVVRRGPVRGWGSLTLDSRAVTAGAIFAAVRGATHDGHDFLASAVAAGASLAIVAHPDRVPSGEISVVVVDDVTAALGSLAKALLAEARRRRRGLRTLAVTGSNGKTTVKEMLRCLSGPATLATQGNFNNEFGVPLSVAPLAPAHRRAVLELGANAPTDVEELASLVRPDVGVVSSIGLAHVEGFGDLDGVRHAKAGLLRGGSPSALVLPASEAGHPIWISAAAAAGTRVVTFGGADADVEVKRDGPRSAVRLVGHGSCAGWEAEVGLALPGLHNAQNLAAAVLGLWLAEGATELPEGRVLEDGLAALELPGGRLRFVDIGGRTVVDDAYNANPASMNASLQLLSSYDAPRFAVLGGMLELGGDEESLHLGVGAAAADAADQVVAVGPRGRWIAQGAGAGARHFNHLAGAAAWLGEHVPPGSVVLLKASRGVRLESIIDALAASWQRGV